MENDATVRQPPTPSLEQIIRWIAYGLGAGLVGLLFLGVLCGPIAIYFGVRARSAAASLDARGRKTKASLIIGLGVFDIVFFLVRVVGTIRMIGTGM